MFSYRIFTPGKGRPGGKSCRRGFLTNPTLLQPPFPYLHLRPRNFYETLPQPQLKPPKSQFLSRRRRWRGLQLILTQRKRGRCGWR